MYPEFIPNTFRERLKGKKTIPLEELEKIASEHHIALTALLEMARWQDVQIEATSLQKKVSHFREVGKYCLWRANNPKLTAQEAKTIVDETIQAFLGLFFMQRRYLNEGIETLKVLLSHPEEAIQNEGIRGTFQFLVERLNDSFNPDFGVLYDHLFGEIVDFCRHQPTGQELDQKLKEFQIFSTSDLFFRKTALPIAHPLSKEKSAHNKLKKIILLSRVTLGADVAVTSIMINRMKQKFPQAELLFLAGPKAEELFGGDSQIRILELSYQRKGSLVDRLSSWIDAVYKVEQELEGLSPEEYLVLDPDSRLTQLGLLPLLKEDQRYLFFESRTYGGQTKLQLGTLVNNWLNEIFSEEEETMPSVYLREKDKTFGKAIGQQIQNPKTISINLGVGGNPLKRVQGDFEFQLVQLLLEKGFFVYLDQGIGEELDRTAAILEKLSAQNYRCQQIKETTTIPELASNLQLLAWNGSIGAFASLIQQSQLYIGYDSAGQHIAAAQEIPVIDIFAGFTHPQMTKRWKPYGKAPVRMISLDTIHSKDTVLVQNVLDQLLHYLDELLP